MKKQVFVSAGLVGAGLVVILGDGLSEKTAIAQGQKPVLPIFEVDHRFPKMPDGLVLGGVGGVNADSHGNVWVFHRPHTLEEGNAHENGYKPGRRLWSSTRQESTFRAGVARLPLDNTTGRTAEACIRPTQSAPPARRGGGPTATDVLGVASTASPSITKTTSG